MPPPTRARATSVNNGKPTAVSRNPAAVGHMFTPADRPALGGKMMLPAPRNRAKVIKPRAMRLAGDSVFIEILLCSLPGTGKNHRHYKQPEGQRPMLIRPAVEQRVSHPQKSPAEAGLFNGAEVLLHCPAGQFRQCLVDIVKRTHGLHASVFQCGELLVGRTLASGEDRTSVPHALACRSSNTCDVGHNRLGHIGLDVGGSFFFSATTDLADHDDRFGLRVVLEHFQNVDEVGARDRVTTDTNTAGLTETGVSGLLDRFIGQGAGARHDTDLARQVDVTGHDADLALAGGDHARAVRPDQTHAQFVTLDLGIQHVEGSDTFGDADNQFDTSVSGFKDGVLAERGRNIDNRCFSASSLDRFFNSVEHGQTQVSSTALTRSNTTNHLGAVFDGLLGVEGTLGTSDTLADYLGVLVDQDAHYLPSAAFTTCTAASVRLVAAMMFKPLSARTLAPRSALLPSRRTTTGTFTPTSFTAPMMPSAIMSQRTIPPKMLTSTAATLLSDRMILNASVTRSLVAPPPTSRKL